MVLLNVQFRHLEAMIRTHKVALEQSYSKELEAAHVVFP